jgi:magnesium transporter
MSVHFELTREFLAELRKAISEQNNTFIKEQTKDLHPIDFATIFDELEIEEAKYLYTHVDSDLKADILVELDEEVREKFLASMSSEEIAREFIENMDSDDAADILAELPDDMQDEVLSHIEDTEQASDILDLLNYDENTAGGIMATELIAVHVDRNVLECVREIRRQAEDVDNIYTIYVVDDDNRLLGLLSLKKLLTVPLRTKVKDIYKSKFISVKVNTPSEEVPQLMNKYDLVVLPVIDQLGRLVGRITIDDVVDVMREEETEDVQKMGGMEALDEPYMTIPFFQMIKKRAGWLVILFLGETLTATAMSFFEDEIAKAVILALFIPLIISSGGNTGSQASTLIIRALALKEVSIKDWWKIVRKEVSTGFVLGVILGAIGFARVALWSLFIQNYGPHWILIAVTVGVSLIGVVMWGALAGSLLPLCLKRLGLDPAVSSAPFVATLVDVTGLIIYFSFSILFLRGLLL